MSTLDALLETWRLQLRSWAAEGAISRAAVDALQLKEAPKALRELVARWASGQFQDLPPVVVLPASAMPGAAGAYAISTGTIYLNQDWLQSASPEEAMAVLTEELGHHLDELINGRDTQGDEGELFALLLQRGGLISERERLTLGAEDDQGRVLLAGQELEVEQARVISTPIRVASPGRTSGEWGNQLAFAALKSDGSVVSWGPQTLYGSGGDSTGVDFDGPGNDLKVTQIFSNWLAFAALRNDGSVVTWGGVDAGGDSSRVSGLLRSGVSQIFSTTRAFAALKKDGSVFTWGDPRTGGNSTGVDFDGPGNDLKVTQIFSNLFAFAALRNDGSVVTWGDLNFQNNGGNSSAVDFDGPINNLKVTEITSTRDAFAALRSDGSVVSWGNSGGGGDSSEVDFDGPSNNLEVTQVFSSHRAFAALRNDGSVVTWGDKGPGGFSNREPGDSRGVDFDGPRNNLKVTQIFSTNRAFAALRNDGSVVTWGNQSYGGSSTRVDFDGPSNNLKVTRIFSTHGAFAALRNDGSVVTWGSSFYGGNSNGVDFDGLNNNLKVLEISGTFGDTYGAAFAALRSDGSVVTWGNLNALGQPAPQPGNLRAPADSSKVDFDGPTNDLKVTKIFSNDYNFAALRSDGSVVTWGNGDDNSSAVANQLRSGVVGFANPFTDDRLMDAQPVLVGSTFVIERLNLPNLKSDANEGSRHTFRITRSGNTALAGSVRFSTSNGTATSGVDFLPFSRDIQFLAGEREKDVYVDSLADSRKEGTERFNVSIAKINSRDTISTASTFGNIFDGALPTTFSISRIPASGSHGQPSSIRKSSDGREGDKLWFTLTRSGNTQNTATVNVSTASGTALVGVDFRSYSASVTFAPGQTSKDIYIETLRDVLVESSERFDVRITPRDQKDRISKSSAYGTISNRPVEYMSVDKDRKPFLMWDYTADYAGNRNYFIQHIPLWNVSFRVKNERLDPSLPTYVYTHGWKDNPTSNDSNIMFSALGRGNYNVINVDWSSMASVDSIGQPDKAVTVTKQVGETVADFLIKNRLSPDKTTLIGHSLGSFVSASAAKEILNRTRQKVKELVGLDNAFGINYDIDARTPGTDPPLDFSTSLAKATSSYTVSDLLGGIDVSAGDNVRAATAQNAYIVQYVRSNNLPLLSLDPLKNSAQRATGLHNGVIGVYADLFRKGALHPRLQKPFDASGKNKANGGFDGVIAAALPWSWELNGEGKISPIRKGPKAIGWVEKYSDPLIHGTDANDIMLFDQFTEVHSGSWLVGYSGNDWLVANQTDNRGVDRLTGGQGADQFWFGYQRYGQKTFPYLNSDVPTDNYGGSSYAVVMDFKPNDDFLNFAWTSSQITYKAGSAINPNLAAAEGPGVGFLNNNDLIAYVRGINPSQVPGLIRNGRVSFEQVAQLDRALFA